MMSEIVNIASYLPAMAAKQPDTLAVACPRPRSSNKYVKLTYRELDEQSDHLVRGFRQIGIERGMHVAMALNPRSGPDFFIVTFALFKMGAVPIFFDPGIGKQNIGKCLEESDPVAFIGSPKAHLGRLLYGWGKGAIRIHVCSGWAPVVGGVSVDRARGLGALAADDPSGGSGGQTLAPTTADEVAAILFTSGSTGPPKGVIYTQGHFVAQVNALRDAFGIEPGEIDLGTFPLFALYAPALGMSAIVPDMDFSRPGAVEPRKIIDPINEFKATTMFGSPALLDRVGRYGAEHGVKLPSLRRVISAGAPVPASVIERFCEMLPDRAQVFTPYGATEALPVATIGSDEILYQTQSLTATGRGVCVGRPAPNITVRIIPISDEPIEQWSDDLALPAGRAGEITVCGPVVTRSYYGRDEATRLAKIAGDNDAVWHRMGDLGYFDEQGRLWFCGRKAHRVRAEVGDMFTVPIESIFNTHPKVRRTALVGVPHGEHEEPVLCVELEADAPDGAWQNIVKDLVAITEKHDITRPVKRFLQRPAFPVDIRHNAKIRREELAVWAAEQLGPLGERA